MFSLLIDQNINEPPFKTSFRIQPQQEDACKEMDLPRRKLETDTAERMTAVTENKDENKRLKLICSNDQTKGQSKIDVDKKDDNVKTSDRETLCELCDTASSNEVNDKSSLGSNVRSQVSHQGLKDQSGISAKTLSVTTSLKMNVQDGPLAPKLLSNSTSFEESSDTAQISPGIDGEIIKESTDLLKTDESSMGLGSAMAQGESEPPLTCRDVGESDSSETGEKSQTSGTENKKKDHRDMSGGTVKNTSHKVKFIGKRVRFNLEGNETSSIQPSKSTDEISKEETKMMFSDEEDEEDKDRSIDEDVSQRISRIQNLLRSDRLRTNRKRKHPVV